MSEKTKIMTVMTAVFAVAVMLAVPILTAVDTDAAFDKGEAGLCISAENPTDAELVEYGFNERDTLLTYNAGFKLFAKIFLFAYGPFNVPTATSETFTIKDYEGIEIGEDSGRFITGYETSAEKVTIEYTAIAAGELLDSDYDSEYSDYYEAYKAVKAYFGNDVSIGDKVTFTGTIKAKHAVKDTTNFASVDGTKYVAKDSKADNYYLYDIDVSIVFTHGGESKTISFYSNQSYECVRATDIDYKGKAYADLKDGDKCDMTYKDTYTYESGSSYYKVDDEKYKIKNEMVPVSPEKNQPVEFFTNAEMQTELNGVKLMIKNCPDSSGSVTVDKTYDGVKSAYSALGAEVMVDDLLLTIVLIGVGVGALILILVVVIIIVLVVKKKKQNQ